MPHRGSALLVLVCGALWGRDAPQLSSVDLTSEFCTPPYPTETFLSDFLLTHSVFMPNAQLCAALLHQYPLSPALTMSVGEGMARAVQPGCKDTSQMPPLAWGQPVGGGILLFQ